MRGALQIEVVLVALWVCLLVHPCRIGQCASPAITFPWAKFRRRELLSSPMSQAVDYIDHSAELYELPTRVRLDSLLWYLTLISARQAAKPVVTYSKAVQTVSMSTSTSTDDLDGEGEDGARKRDGGSGRETEDELRRRILEELEDERKALEAELKDLKKKEEERTVSGELLLSPSMSS